MIGMAYRLKQNLNHRGHRGAQGKASFAFTIGSAMTSAFTTVSELSQLLRRKKVSPVEITRACLEKIEKLNPVLNAFITVLGEWALEVARTADAEIMLGRSRGPMRGVPF